MGAVREFRVVSGRGYSAEYGGYSGGAIQMVTKSGTNNYHGTAYGFHRNDNLDARGFFDDSKPEFRRTQFGASGGGPIRRDKAFFFGNYEGLRQAKLGRTQIGKVPDENIHRGILPNGTPVAIAPEIKPYLDLYPLPNGLNLGNGVGQRLVPVSDLGNENYFVTRGDYYLTPNQTLFARFTSDQGDDSTPNALGISNTVVLSRMRYGTAQYEHILSPTLLSTTQAAFNRTRLAPTLRLNIDYPKSLFFLHHQYPPTIGYTGVDNLDAPSNNTTYRVQNLWQFSQSFSSTQGAHSMKFGGSFQKVGFNTNGPAAGAFGSFAWNSVEDFLRDASLLSLQVEVEGADTARTVRQRVLGLYFQDDWQVCRNLTVNLGLRYEPWTGPSEKHNRVSTIRDWYRATQFDTPETSGTDMYFNSPGEKSFSPRAGFAWDVKGDGKTAVRAGFGIFHVMLLSPYLNTIVRKNPPYAGTFSSNPERDRNLNLANAAAYVTALTPSIKTPVLSPSTFSEVIQFNLDPMYETKFNLSVEREIAPNLSVTLGYLGSRGTHLTQKMDGNAAPPSFGNGRPFVAANTRRPNPNNGVITYSSSDAKSFYNGMIVEVKKRFAQGFQLQGAYTWSKAIDDSSTGLGNSDFAEGIRSQPYDPHSDRGLSSFHLSHNLAINGLWSIPFPVSSGFVSYLLGGWRISSIFKATSGTPFEVNVGGRNAPALSRSAGGQRPDLLAGRNNANVTSGVTAGCTFVGGVAGPSDNNPRNPNTVLPGQKLGTIDLYYDPCAFSLPPAGFYGNAGRNFLTEPRFINVDFSLLKSMPVGITEGSQLEFHADFFNLFNHPNFGRPANNVLNAVTTSARGLVAGSDRITTTDGKERQIQLGLKLIF